MKNKLFYLVFFSIILAASRLIPHPPNFTPILASVIVSPLLIKDRIFGIAIPIIALFISDIVIGFHPYQFVIYSTIIIIGLLSPMKKNYKILGILAIFASFLFFITTNFAVWIIWDYYPKTYEGLKNCYLLALPFFKNTILSTLIFTFIITSTSKYLEIINEKITNSIAVLLTKKRLIK